MPQRQHGGGMTAALQAPVDQLKRRGDFHTMLDRLHHLLIRVVTRSVAYDSPIGMGQFQTRLLPWPVRVVVGEEPLDLFYSIELAHWFVPLRTDPRNYAFTFKVTLMPPGKGYVLAEFAEKRLCMDDGVVLDYASLRDRGIGPRSPQNPHGFLFFDTEWPDWVNQLWENTYPLQPSDLEMKLSSGQVDPNALLVALAALGNEAGQDAPDATMRVPRATPPFAYNTPPPSPASPAMNAADPMNATNTASPDDGFAQLVRDRDVARAAVRADEAAITHAYEQYLTDAQRITQFHHHPEKQLEWALEWAQTGFQFPPEWRSDTDKADIVDELDRVIASARERLAHYAADQVMAVAAEKALIFVCAYRGHPPSATDPTTCATCGAVMPVVVAADEDDAATRRAPAARAPKNSGFLS